MILKNVEIDIEIVWGYIWMNRVSKNWGELVENECSQSAVTSLLPILILIYSTYIPNSDSKFLNNYFTFECIFYLKLVILVQTIIK
jgi:hypothetical protein